MANKGNNSLHTQVNTYKHECYLTENPCSSFSYAESTMWEKGNQRGPFFLPMIICLNPPKLEEISLQKCHQGIEKYIRNPYKETFWIKMQNLGQIFRQKIWKKISPVNCMKDNQEMGPVRQDRESHDLTNEVNSFDMRKSYESQNLTQTQGRSRSSLSIFPNHNPCQSSQLRKYKSLKILTGCRKIL